MNDETKIKERVEGYFNRAYDSLKMNDCSRAIEYVERILNFEPNNLEAVTLKKFLFLEKKKIKEYEDYIKKINSFFDITAEFIDCEIYKSVSTNFFEFLKVKWNLFILV